MSFLNSIGHGIFIILLLLYISATILLKYNNPLNESEIYGLKVFLYVSEQKEKNIWLAKT